MHLYTFFAISILTWNVKAVPDFTIQKKDVAVLFDTSALASSHTYLFDFIKGKYQDVDIEILSSKTFNLFENNSPKYRNLVLIITHLGNFYTKVTMNSILEFFDAGGNVILITDSNKGDVGRLISQFGFINGPKSFLINHDNTYFSDDGSHTKFVVNESCFRSFPGVFTKKPRSIVYGGISFYLNHENPLTFPLIVAPETAFTQESKEVSIKKTSAEKGHQMLLAGGLEGRNNARAIVVTSTFMFNDSALDQDFGYKTFEKNINTFSLGNSGAMKDMIQWTFNQHSLIRITEPKHVLVSSQETLSEYVVDTLVEYSIKVEVYNSERGWKPFKTNMLQLELIRLTLFSRITYNYSENGVYTARFYIPDFIGTYNLETRFRKPGYTPINHQVKIIVRPRKHNDYDRFLVGAYPYYITAFLMMFMSTLLVFLLINEDKSRKEKLA